MFKSTSNVVILLSRAEQVLISSLLHRCVGIHQQDYFIFLGFQVLHGIQNTSLIYNRAPC